MNLQIVSFEVAKLAAQKGYEDESDMYYNEHGDLKFDPHYDITNRQPTKLKIWYHAPYQEEVSGWLRTEYIHVSPEPQRYMGSKSFVCWYVSINDKYLCVDDGSDDIQDFKSYEEALEAGLFEGLKLIKEAL